MATYTQNIADLLIDRENVNLSMSPESLIMNEPEEIQRSTQPFSELKSGKFRRIFDRHIIARH